MDVIGYATFAIPVIGEISDIVWAPISALLFYLSFGGWRGGAGALINFVEEVLPGTDFIPVFTIAWLLRRFVSKKTLMLRPQGK